MTYTVAQVANRTGITPHTLRYYDKEGLLPFVDRSPSGIRMFKESDFEWLNIINCLKGTGMPIKKIKEFIDLCMLGDSTIGERLEFVKRHKKEVERQINELNRHMELIDYKISYYEAAAKAGTLDIYRKGKEA